MNKWQQHQMTTDKLRGAAELLRGQMSGVQQPDGSMTESDQAIGQAVACLYMAAEHVDALEQTGEPHIVQITLDSVDNVVGLDAFGGLWAYITTEGLENGGWRPMQSGLFTKSSDK